MKKPKKIHWLRDGQLACGLSRTTKRPVTEKKEEVTCQACVPPLVSKETGRNRVGHANSDVADPALYKPLGSL